MFQPFDSKITRNEARSHADRYVLTWGSVEPLAWRSGNSDISAGYYLAFDTDADMHGFGNLGHPLGWWRARHPDWVLYQCDRRTVAWVPGLPDNVPLDISNPAVVAYQMNTVVPYMQANGYTSLTVDVLALTNAPAACGVWTDGHRKWVQKFTGEKEDPLWTAAVMYWTAYSQWYLHAASPQVAMVVNTPGWITQGDPDEEALISHLDGFADEGGFTGFGNHLVNETSFNNRVWWAEYIQGQGKAYLVADLWQNGEPNAAQRDFAASTYLMGKEHQAALFTAQYGAYGAEHYWPEFASLIGTPCGPMYADQGAYFRKYSRALIVVNPTSKTAKVNLPKSAPFYRDMENRQVDDPLTVLRDDGYVLLTSKGC